MSNRAALVARSLGAFVLATAALSAPAPGQTGGPAAPDHRPWWSVPLTENSDFAAPPASAAPDAVPSWRVVAGAPRVERRAVEAAGGPATIGTLVLPAGSVVEQPIALPAESVRWMTLHVHNEDANTVVVVGDEAGREVRLSISSPDDRKRARSEPGAPDIGEIIDLASLDGWGGAPPTPRLRLRVEVADGAEETRVGMVRVETRFDVPDEAALRAELVAELDWIFSLWLERGLDRVGPRETAFLSTAFDALTGAPLAYLDGGAHPFYALLGRALQVEPNARWRAAYDAYLTDLFALAFHPDTGLPRVWNVRSDQPDDETPREVAYAFGHLLDIAEDGPEEWRDRALAQAVRIGDAVLAKGVLPDGEVAARYRPRDGEPNTSYPPLRRLDVPAELARLGAMTGDDRYTAAARDAFAQFEFTHFWPGNWEAIDPGFDDNYGHYGARAVEAWEAHPDEAAFRNVAEGGARHYMPIWRDALQLGGNIAADQVRCWRILRDVAELEPSLTEAVADLVELAARNHYRGQQYADGTWGDVTIYRFDPKAHLEVGDLPGLPRNLVEGLAFAHDADLGLDTPEMRALFTSAFRVSRDHYKREFGYLSTRTESPGANPAGGGVRLAPGLVEMLHQLEDSAR